MAITVSEIRQLLWLEGCLGDESSSRYDDFIAEDGIRKHLSQLNERFSSTVEQREESLLGTPQLCFVFQKIARLKIIDILSHYSLRKAIVDKLCGIVNDRVVHLVLEPPKRVECPYGRRVSFGDCPYDPRSGHGFRRPSLEEGEASSDTLDRVQVDGTGEEEGMPTIVGACDHGVHFVEIESVACQYLGDLSPQCRLSTNDLDPSFVM